MWVSLFSDRYLDPPAKSTATSPTTPSGGRTNGIGHDNPFEDALRRRRENEARPRGSSRRRVTRVYGVEPNTDIHGELRQRVRDAGLEGVYEVVPVGIEDLERSGKVQKGSVDCIVTVLCLCTIPDPKYNIRELYDYLKPGGRCEDFCMFQWSGRIESLVVELSVVELG
ncbi:putative -alpha-glucan branching enzyme protein [Phaeoacremonium minimum UCRPA7]|uniref:Putative-alpha-glucan branching enzyme protein n=1 Tax=Phaeoacremonium minimum (strain UCR-PA7) TaxID=1286976 RepID=R8BRA0_PHAM7|nr:putative -alpha-glucan branching enzyme protein [Phaeoacremonium minimum UCRPA7]EOO01898.1 putative -alpha-glucan branching enzyme protein [Phaeoacremonium minimum UCRPA7]